MSPTVVHVVGQQPTDRRWLIHEERDERVGAHRRVRLLRVRMATASNHLSLD
jgi:hypothetical protein